MPYIIKDQEAVKVVPKNKIVYVSTVVHPEGELQILGVFKKLKDAENSLSTMKFPEGTRELKEDEIGVYIDLCKFSIEECEVQ